jgi:hypothetical protein
MAAPHPPQGNQTQVTERPLRVFAEQYVGEPLPIGATTDYGDPPLFVDGLPRVLTPAGWVLLNLTDYVITNRYTGQALEVISADEYAERFGPGGAPLPAEGEQP